MTKTRDVTKAERLLFIQQYGDGATILLAQARPFVAQNIVCAEDALLLEQIDAVLDDANRRGAKRKRNQR